MSTLWTTYEHETPFVTFCIRVWDEVAFLDVCDIWFRWNEDVLTSTWCSLVMPTVAEVYCGAIEGSDICSSKSWSYEESACRCEEEGLELHSWESQKRW